MKPVCKRECQFKKEAASANRGNNERSVIPAREVQLWHLFKAPSFKRMANPSSSLLILLLLNHCVSQYVCSILADFDGKFDGSKQAQKKPAFEQNSNSKREFEPKLELECLKVLD